MYEDRPQISATFRQPRCVSTIETKDVKKYQGDILSYMDLSYPEIGQKIEENRAIDEELVNKIMDAVKEYKG